MGGWVLERALERGHEMRALSSETSLLSSLASKVAVIAGNSFKKSALQELLYDGDKLLVETVVCVMAEMSIVEQLTTANALSELFAAKNTQPRVVWMASALDDELQQACTSPEDSVYPTKSDTPCFPIVPKLDLGCLFPLLQQPVADDETIETFVLKTLPAKAVFIRPSESLAPVPYTTFTSAWRAHGGDNPNYQLLTTTDEVEKHPSISRRALASAILDLIIDESRDGTSVTAVQRQGRAHTVVAESVDL